MINRHYYLKLSIKFIIDSIDRKSGGSRAFYSRFYHPIKGWSSMYPETSGYLIPTLIKYGERYNDPNVIMIAKNISDWLLSIQNKDGSFFGGLNDSKDKNKSIFNSAQIILVFYQPIENLKSEIYQNQQLNVLIG